MALLRGTLGWQLYTELDVVAEKRPAMLFRPSPDQNPTAVQALLDAWNFEADDLRRIARAAMVTGQAMSSTVLAAQDIHEGLVSLLDELDQALERVSSGTKLFIDLLHAQTKATALLESIGKTQDILEGCVKVDMTGPTIIGPSASDANLTSIEIRQAARKAFSVRYRDWKVDVNGDADDAFPGP